MTTTPVGPALVGPALVLLEPLLGVRHGFAVPGGQEPPGLLFALQGHGAAVVRAEACLAAPAQPEADAVVSVTRGVGACVVTADCVPVLLAVRDGRGVAAVHAGWRWFSVCFFEVGVSVLAQASGKPVKS